jgi:hypothetical protein
MVVTPVFRCSYEVGMFANEARPERDPLDPAYELLCGLDIEAEQLAAAIHEAGHAVVGITRGLGLESVSITAHCLEDGRIAFGGMSVISPKEYHRLVAGIERGDLAACLKSGVMTCAGPAAERRYRVDQGLPQRALFTAGRDHHAIDDCIAKRLGERRDAFLRLCWAQAQRAVLVDSVWQAILDLGGALQEELTMLDASQAPGETTTATYPPATAWRARSDGRLERKPSPLA